MSYQPQHAAMGAAVRNAAEDVKAERPDAWQALDRKDPLFARLVVEKLRRRGIECALNGKRGNVHDLSCDVINFVNPTGAPDVTGQVSGIELRDFIYAAEDPLMRRLGSWGDSTPDTIAHTQAAWVLPEGSTAPNPAPTPAPEPPPGLDIARALQQIAEMYPVIMGLKKYL